MKGADTGRNGARRTRRWLIAALLAATAFIAAPSLASADGGSGTATLSTDQLSYSPGGVVDLSGAGFVAGDSITVTLADSLSGSTYATANVTAGSDGSFTDVDLTLPPDFMSSLAATATDSATGDSASTPVTETLAPPSFTPTITTDQQDYAPGSVVTITGSGWPAGDAVSVFTDDSDNNSWSQTDQVTTDASGDFTDRVTLPLMFIANYTVTASDANGLSATTSFTDGNVTAATVDVRKSDCVTQQTIFNIGDTLCAHSTITTVTGNGAGQLFVQWVNPSGANVGSAVQHNGNAGDSFNDSLALTSTSPTGTWKVEVCSNSSCNSNQVLNSENFTVGLGTTTTVTSSGTPSTYGSPVTFTASVSASTNPGAHGTVTFKDGTTAICTNVALNSSSQATCSTSTLSATDSPHSITAVYSGATSGSTTWNGSTSSAFSQAVSQKALTVTGITASNKVYDGNTSAAINTSGATLNGVVTGDTVTLGTGSATGAFLTRAVGTGKTVQISGLTISGASAGNYTLTQPTTTADISAKNLTVTGAVANGKQYDGSTSATVDFSGASLSGIVTGDSVSLDPSAYSASFATKTVANNKPVTVTGVKLGGSDSGDYTVSQPTGLTANITAKSLTISGAVANNKQYDATTTATVDFGGASLVGVVSGDHVSIDSSGYSASFADKNVGSNKPVAVTGVALSGSDSGNYTVSQPSGLTAKISQAPLDISAAGDSKTYDGTTTSTGTPTVGLGQLEGGDTVTGKTQAFQSKNVLGAGHSVLTVTGYTINDGNSGGNYSVTLHPASGTITPLGLTITGAVAQDKAYDGTTAATVDFSAASLVTPVSGDHVSIDSSGYSASFADKNVGSNKPVTVTGVALSGSDDGNYTLTQPSLSATIKAKALTLDGAIAQDKTYDGGTAATVDFSSASLNGVIGSEHVGFDASAYQASFAGKDVGSHTVTVSGVALSDSDDGNYTLTQPSLSASIDRRDVTATITAADKTYDSTPGATITNCSLESASGEHGVVSPDVVRCDATNGQFDSANAGSGQNVTADVSLNGGDSGNYQLTSHTASTTASINQAPLYIYAAADSKVYDGTTSSSGTPTIGAGGLQGSDYVDGLTQAFTSRNALGAGNSILHVTGYVIHDGNSGGNYTVTLHDHSGTITPLGLAITGAKANSKTYDATPAATVDWSGASLVGVIGLDDVSIDHSGYSASFGNKNVGTAKPVSVSGVALSGSDSGNYTVSQPTGLSADISKAGLDIYAAADSKVYDGTTSSSGTPTIGAGGLQGSDYVDGLTQAFTSRNALGAGNSILHVTGYVIHDGNSGGNYTVTLHDHSGTISARPITVTAQADNRTYNATTSSNKIPQVTSGTIVSGDTGNFGQAYQTKTVGTGKTLIPSGYVADGNSGNNYAIAFQNNNTGVITPASLTVSGITANNKVWDGTTTATLNTGAASLVGVLGTDSVTLNTGTASGTFTSSAVGAWTVNVSGLTLSGSDSGNYLLLQPTTTASIAAWNAAGKGFYAPVGADATHSVFTPAPGSAPTNLPAGMVWNTVKGGQTVPLKFNIFAGAVEMTAANAFPNADVTKAFQTAKLTTCTDASATDSVDYTTTTGQTTLRYDTTGMQWITNWATPKVNQTTCYRTWVTFADGSTLEAFFQLTR